MSLVHSAGNTSVKVVSVLTFAILASCNQSAPQNSQHNTVTSATIGISTLAVHVTASPNLPGFTPEVRISTPGTDRGWRITNLGTPAFKKIVDPGDYKVTTSGSIVFAGKTFVPTIDNAHPTVSAGAATVVNVTYKAISMDTEAPKVSLGNIEGDYAVNNPAIIEAIATDDTGVTKVEFYKDGVLKYTDTTSPYELTESYTDADLGKSYSYLAKGYDAAGNVGSASAKSVRVSFKHFDMSASGRITSITTGSDGNIWFTDQSKGIIGRINITTTGTIDYFPVPTVNAQPDRIIVGPDKNLWFMESPLMGSGKIGRITTAGKFDEFSLTGVNRLYDITVGPDGNLWFTDILRKEVGRITPAGVIATFPILRAVPLNITAGPDGNLWATGEENVTSIANTLIRITPMGAVSYTTVSGVSGLHDIVLGPDNNLWMQDNNSFPDNSGLVRFDVGAGTFDRFATPGKRGLWQTIDGKDGNLWSTGRGELVVNNTSGVFTRTITPKNVALSDAIWTLTVGSDNNVWFHHLFTGIWFYKR